MECAVIRRVLMTVIDADVAPRFDTCHEVFLADLDGEGRVLRLWELVGTGGRCEVRLPEGMAADSVQPADLRGRPQGRPIPVRGGAFEAEVPPFAPASFLLGGGAK